MKPRIIADAVRVQEEITTLNLPQQEVRAERRAGQMLAEMDLKSGVKPIGNTMLPIKNLEEIGVSKMQSSRWQKLAAIPEDQFERAVEAAKEVAGEVTTAAMLKLQKSLNSEKSVSEEQTGKNGRFTGGNTMLPPATGNHQCENHAPKPRHLTQGQAAAIVAAAQDWSNAQTIGRPSNNHDEKMVTHVTFKTVWERALPF